MRGSAAKAPVSRDELEALVREIRHVREEHRRTHLGSGVRRRLEERLLELEQEFERLLQEWLVDEATRRAWRAHLHENGPEPSKPAPRRPLIFRGVSEAGSVVEVREREDGEYAVEVDGSLVERIEAELDFSDTDAPRTFFLDSVAFRETFASSPEALAALRRFLAGDEPIPPWRYAAELAADGIVDRHFGLTPRGHRALAQHGAPRTG